MGEAPDAWLTVPQAVERTGASEATVKRFAVSAAQTGGAIRVPVTPGGTKPRWLLRSSLLDAWHLERSTDSHAAGRVVASSKGRQGAGSSRRATGRAPVATSSTASANVDDDRLDRLEQTVQALTERIEAVLAIATDEVQAARTVALAEKSVSERLRAAQKAQQEAAAARAKSQQLQEAATAQARVAADLEAQAAEALGLALDDRSSQLDQLLTPGSAATMTGPPHGPRTAEQGRNS